MNEQLAPGGSRVQEAPSLASQVATLESRIQTWRDVIEHLQRMSVYYQRECFKYERLLSEVRTQSKRYHDDLKISSANYASLERDFAEVTRQRDLYHADLKISGANNKQLRKDLAEAHKKLEDSNIHKFEQALRNERDAHASANNRAAQAEHDCTALLQENHRLRKYITDTGTKIHSAIAMLKS